MNIPVVTETQVSALPSLFYDPNAWQIFAARVEAAGSAAPGATGPAGPAGPAGPTGPAGPEGEPVYTAFGYEDPSGQSYPSNAVNWRPTVEPGALYINIQELSTWMFTGTAWIKVCPNDDSVDPEPPVDRPLMVLTQLIDFYDNPSLPLGKFIFEGMVLVNTVIYKLGEDSSNDVTFEMIERDSNNITAGYSPVMSAWSPSFVPPNVDPAYTTNGVALALSTNSIKYRVTFNSPSYCPKLNLALVDTQLGSGTLRFVSAYVDGILQNASWFASHTSVSTGNLNIDEVNGYLEINISAPLEGCLQLSGTISYIDFEVTSSFSVNMMNMTISQ